MGFLLQSWRLIAQNNFKSLCSEHIGSGVVGSKETMQSDGPPWHELGIHCLKHFETSISFYYRGIWYLPSREFSCGIIPSPAFSKFVWCTTLWDWKAVSYTHQSHNKWQVPEHFIFQKLHPLPIVGCLNSVPHFFIVWLCYGNITLTLCLQVIFVTVRIFYKKKKKMHRQQLIHTGINTHI